MKKAEAAFRHLRDQRLGARAAVDARLAAITSERTQRSIGGRVADKLGSDAQAMLDEGLALAYEQKAALATTAGLLVLWLIRKPVIAALLELVEQRGKHEDL